MKANKEAAGHRMDHFVDANNMVDANAGVTVITPKGTSKVKGGMAAFVDMGDDAHIENHVSPLCKIGGEVMRSEFIADVEQQYELYCKIAEEHGFIDLNAKKNGFRCTTKSNEFNAGWVAFTGAIAAMREDQKSKIDELQKRVDSILKVVQSMRNEVKHGHLSEDESQTLTSYANDLEQALKGGGE